MVKIRGCGLDPGKIFVKKDLHPMVRSEWRRLNDVVKAESSKPANHGVSISLDPKQRKIFRGDPKENIVVDKWSINFY